MTKTIAMIAISLFMFSATAAQAVECTVELKSPRGRVMDTSTVSGYTRQEACNYAMSACKNSQVHGRYRGGGLYCEIVRPLVTVSCNAKSMRPGSRVPFAFYSGTVTGTEGQDLFSRACSNALVSCANSSPTSMRCHADNGASMQGNIVVRETTPRRHERPRIRVNVRL